MTERMKVRPAKGLSVRREPPEKGCLEKEGEEVRMTRYWRRRLADGDVERAPKTRQKES